MIFVHVLHGIGTLLPSLILYTLGIVTPKGYFCIGIAIAEISRGGITIPNVQNQTIGNIVKRKLLKIDQRTGKHRLLLHS